MTLKLFFFVLLLFKEAAKRAAADFELGRDEIGIGKKGRNQRNIENREE